MSEFWSDGWLLHQDNIPTHTALSVKQFQVSKNITVIGHPPCILLIWPNVTFFICYSKNLLIGDLFYLCEEVQAKNGESPGGPSKLLPEILPAMETSNVEVWEC
ncbi:hypothetical protein TNCV_1020221 [Trichonephila clavipes]|nr:hypothetical protein TNCV_1020221 [Trichonephila clavipes]